MACVRVAFHENDGNRENDEDNSDSYKQGVECWNSRKSRKPRKWRKPREPRVQTTGSPNHGFRNTQNRKSLGHQARNPPKIPKYQKNTAFTRTFSKSSRELLPSSLWHESGTRSEKLVQINLLFCVDFWGWILLLWNTRFFLRLFCLARLFPKNSLKRFLGRLTR